MRRIHCGPLVLLAAVLGCADAGTSDGTLRYYLSADPVTLDPALSTDVQSGEMVAMLFDNLVQFDVDGRLVPGLATRWEVDSTGRVYTFHVRTGARFHDGRPVTARDVEASILRALAPGSTGRHWPLEPIQGAREYADGSAQGIAGLIVESDAEIAAGIQRDAPVQPRAGKHAVAALPCQADRGSDRRFDRGHQR